MKRTSFEKVRKNSPGHWPSGVLENKIIWFVAPPMVPHKSPGPGELNSHESLMGMPIFFNNLLFKNIVKTQPAFFYFFCRFSDLPCFFCILSYSGTSLVVMCDLLSGLTFIIGFLKNNFSFFRKKNMKTENTRLNRQNAYYRKGCRIAKKARGH